MWGNWNKWKNPKSKKKSFKSIQDSNWASSSYECFPPNLKPSFLPPKGWHLSTSSTPQLNLKDNMPPLSSPCLALCVFIASTVEQLSPSLSPPLPFLFLFPLPQPPCPAPFSLPLFARHSPESTASASILQLLHKPSILPPEFVPMKDNTASKSDQFPPLCLQCQQRALVSAKSPSFHVECCESPAAAAPVASLSDKRKIKMLP